MSIFNQKIEDKEYELDIPLIILERMRDELADEISTKISEEIIRRQRE